MLITESQIASSETPWRRMYALMTYSATMVRLMLMWMSAMRFTPDGSDSMSMKPGTAAMRAPTMPPIMVYHATTSQFGLVPPKRWTRSQISEKSQRPIGTATSMGWIGCLAMLEGVLIV